MIGSPRAILFDEPLSNLDARLRERMRMELLALRERAPFTSIYVTHDQLEAMTLGDRVVVMRAGTVEQVGTPEEVYKRPRTRFAADFMGIPNLIEGAVSEVVGSKVAVDTPLGTLPAAGWRTDWSAGSRCTIAVRPTSLQLRTGDERAGRPGRVVRSVFQGVTSVHIVDIGGIEIAVESLEESRLAAGADVVVSPAAGAVFAVLDD
jgi:ABC-type Fe3+/spermidine/putrescine transport system ATPase subunit